MAKPKYEPPIILNFPEHLLQTDYEEVSDLIEESTEGVEIDIEYNRLVVEAANKMGWLAPAVESDGYILEDATARNINYLKDGIAQGIVYATTAGNRKYKPDIYMEFPEPFLNSEYEKYGASISEIDTDVSNARVYKYSVIEVVFDMGWLINVATKEELRRVVTSKEVAHIKSILEKKIESHKKVIKKRDGKKQYKPEITLDFPQDITQKDYEEYMNKVIKHEGKADNPALYNRLVVEAAMDMGWINNAESKPVMRNTITAENVFYLREELDKEAQEALAYPNA